MVVFPAGIAEQERLESLVPQRIAAGAPRRPA